MIHLQFFVQISLEDDIRQYNFKWSSGFHVYRVFNYL